MGQDGSKLDQKKSKISSLLTRRTSDPPKTSTANEALQQQGQQTPTEYTSTSRSLNDSPVLAIRSSLPSIAKLGQRLKAAGSLASLKWSQSSFSSQASSLTSSTANSIAKSHPVDPLQSIFLLNSLQSFAERAESRALQIATTQLSLDTTVVNLSVACASRVHDLASRLHQVHVLQVNAAVVNSLHREVSAATRSLELLFSQTVQLDQQLTALLGDNEPTTTTTDEGALALAASLAPRTLMWQQFESVRKLYEGDELSDSYASWAEIIPQWSANKGFVWVRQLWSRGVPPQFRAIVWCDAIGNELMVSRSEYDAYCEVIEAKVVVERTQRAEHQAAYRRVLESEALARATMGASSTAPRQAVPIVAPDAIASELRMVTVDVPRTFGELQIFGDGTAIPSELNPSASKLRRVVLAASLRPGSPGYCQGMTHIAATLLLYMDEFDAYCCLVNLLERHFFHSLFAMDIDQLNRHLALYDMFLAARLPDVYNHLRALGVRTSAYALDWFMTLFGKALEHRCCARVFDQFVLEGESFLFRVAIAILTLQRRRLLGAEIENVTRILKDTPFLDEKLLFDTVEESVAVFVEVAESVDKIETEERQRRVRVRREATLASIDAIKCD